MLLFQGDSTSVNNHLVSEVSLRGSIIWAASSMIQFWSECSRNPPITDLLHVRGQDEVNDVSPKVGEPLHREKEERVESGITTAQGERREGQKWDNHCTGRKKRGSRVG